jgi:hypothetical protein
MAGVDAEVILLANLLLIVCPSVQWDIGLLKVGEGEKGNRHQGK